MEYGLANYDRLSEKHVSETSFATLDFKSVSNDGIFEGYASLFEREDLDHDVVVRGAFQDCLANGGARAVKLLFQHDASQPIGTWLELKEDTHGLFARGQLLTSIAKAREVLSLMRAGALDGLSIGFKTVEGRRDHRTGVRRLKKIDLWEISIVTFPMQPEARISTLKAGPFSGGIPTERNFERWLTRDAGLSRSQARTLICSGFRTLARKLDAAGGAIDKPATASIQQASLAAAFRAAAKKLAIGDRTII